MDLTSDQKTVLLIFGIPLIIIGIIALSISGPGFFTIIIIIGIIYAIITLTKNTSRSSKTQNLKRYSIDFSGSTKEYDRIILPDNSTYSLKRNEILDKNNMYQDNLITKAINKNEQEMRTDFKQQVKSKECKGMTARCTICMYLWKIRKDKHIPASCPSCHKQSVTIKYEDNI